MDILRPCIALNVCFLRPNRLERSWIVNASLTPEGSSSLYKIDGGNAESEGISWSPFILNDFLVSLIQRSDLRWRSKYIYIHIHVTSLQNVQVSPTISRLPVVISKHAFPPPSARKFVSPNINLTSWPVTPISPCTLTTHLKSNYTPRHSLPIRLPIIDLAVATPV